MLAAEVLCGRVEQGCFDRAVRVTLRLVERSGADCVLLSDLNWQFCVIFARILGDLDLGAVPRILPAPRDAAGLPLSAELAALDPPARRQAERFARVMDDTARVIRLGADPAIACRGARARLADAGIAAVDYLEMRHAATLARVQDPRLEGPARLFGAVRLRGLRLIDSRPLP
ncbi:MAG: hypothetical protein D6686_16680 [Alphaproteobacteria bacterium]|nr:MAG: hypothetical protein D6686_16680 [Alphaproteobacteria bacterium]